LGADRPFPAVRAAAASDAPGIGALGREVDRDQLASEEALRALLERPAAPATERLVAARGGRVVAWAPSGIYTSKAGWFWIGVAKSERRCGLGGRLYARIEARLRRAGAVQMTTTPNDEDGRAFLFARAFEVANVVRNLELDPRTVAPPPDPSAGLRVATLAEATGSVEALYRLYAEARADVPSETPRVPWTFEEWRAETIDSPFIDLDASVVVFEHDDPVALAWLYSDREGRRAEALMAATRRDRRGRGLAGFAKAESARRAAGLGITRSSRATTWRTHRCSQSTAASASPRLPSSSPSSSTWRADAAGSHGCTDLDSPAYTRFVNKSLGVLLRVLGISALVAGGLAIALAVLLLVILLGPLIFWLAWNVLDFAHAVGLPELGFWGIVLATLFLIAGWGGKVLIAGIVFLVDPSWFQGSARVRWPEPTFRNFVAVVLLALLASRPHTRARERSRN
jgi:hypothetical protein